MTQSKSVSVWDVYDSFYKRGMSKGKNKFHNWIDNILKPDKTRFSIGHLWHGKDSAQHVGGKATLFSFKGLFDVKSGSEFKKGKLFDEILSKGSVLHDYTKYNKSNPDEWKDSKDNLMSIMEHEGKKYAKFVGRDEHEGEISLYELKGASEDFNKAMKRAEEPKDPGISFQEGWDKAKKALFGDKKWGFGMKSDILETLADKQASKDVGVTLNKEGRNELRKAVKSQERKKKGLKAGVAISNTLANELQSAWEKSYRG